jgi:thymidylate synthase
VSDDRKLTTIMNMRSADMFLGVPFNIASYAFLTEMMAQQSGLAPGEVVINMGDCHMYLNHAEQVREQLSRAPKAYPTLDLRKAADIFSYQPSDFVIENYDPWPAIKAPIAV